MIEHVERRFELRLERSVDDTAYGSGSMVHWVVEEKGIEPHISVWDKTQRKDDTFSGSAFKYDEHNDRYECPAGRYLKTAWRSKQKNPYRYRASLYDCQDCVLNSSAARIRRSEKSIAVPMSRRAQLQRRRHIINPVTHHAIEQI
jgi:hypothetical protein